MYGKLMSIPDGTTDEQGMSSAASARSATTTRRSWTGRRKTSARSSRSRRRARAPKEVKAEVARRSWPSTTPRRRQEAEAEFERVFAEGAAGRHARGRRRPGRREGPRSIPSSWSATAASPTATARPGGSSSKVVSASTGRPSRPNGRDEDRRRRRPSRGQEAVRSAATRGRTVAWAGRIVPVVVRLNPVEGNIGVTG